MSSTVVRTPWEWAYDLEHQDRQRTLGERDRYIRHNEMSFTPYTIHSTGRPSFHYSREGYRNALYDLQGSNASPPGLKGGDPIESFTSFTAERHSCEWCTVLDGVLQSLGKKQKLCNSLSQLRQLAESCKIYMIILSLVELSDSIQYIGEVNIFADRVSLSVETDPLPAEATSVKRVVAELIPSRPDLKPIEITILPESWSDCDYLLYSEWLRVCDGSHKHVESHVAKLPRRVIDVGDQYDSDCIRLCEADGHAHGIYIALSHRWQNDTPMTTEDNLRDRRASIKRCTVFQKIFSRYSGLELTQVTDRPVAIVGIEHRLMTLYQTVSLYGIIEAFLCETLLWYRADVKWLSPLVDFDAKVSSWSVRGKKVPSWSWMSYVGQISYRSIAADGWSHSRWLYMYHNHSRSTVIARLAHIAPSCSLDPTESTFKTENEDVVGWVRFDCENDSSVQFTWCIELATQTANSEEGASLSENIASNGSSYIMLLTQVAHDTADILQLSELGLEIGEAKLFRRVGLALLPSRHLVLIREIAQVF